MPWNGSGTFSRIYSWVADKAAGLDISSSRMDTDTDDIVSNGLSNCITRDGQGSASANQPMNGFVHTNVGLATARNEYAQAGQVQDGSLDYGTVGGTANAIALTLSPAPPAYVAGQSFSFIAGSTNTGATTLNVNSLGAKNIYKLGPSGPVALVGGEIISGNVVHVDYDGTQFQLKGVIGPATATAGNLPSFKDGSGAVLQDSGFAIASLTGVVLPFAGSSAPTGWLLCYGQAVSRTTYAALFAVIGTTYGAGDGSTTFNVPDMRGRVAAGVDNMGGTAANRLGSGSTGGVTGSATLGAVGGEQSHTLSLTEMPVHNHTGSTDVQGSHQHSGSDYGGVGSSVGSRFARGDQSQGNTTAADPDGAHSHNLSINNAGGGGAHNNVQPTLVLNYIIKT